MRALSTREKIIACATVAAVLLGLFLRWMDARPARGGPGTGIREISAKIQKCKALLAAKERWIAVERPFYENIQKAASKQDLFVRGLSELEALAEKSGIRVLEIRPQGSFKKVSSFEEALVDLRTEGSAADHVKFVHAMTRSLWLYDIRRFQLAAKSDSLEGSFTIALTMP